MSNSYPTVDKNPIGSILLAAYRAANPSSRAVGLVRLIRNGGARKQYGCTLCGAEGPTFCGRWRETKLSITWREEHAAAHVEAAKERLSSAAALIASDAIKAGRTEDAIAILAAAQLEGEVSL